MYIFWALIENCIQDIILVLLFPNSNVQKVSYDIVILYIRLSIVFIWSRAAPNLVVYFIYIINSNDISKYIGALTREWHWQGNKLEPIPYHFSLSNFRVLIFWRILCNIDLLIFMTLCSLSNSMQQLYF